VRNDPPPDLKEIVAELARIGVKDPHLVAQTVVNTVAGTEFRAEGSAKLEEPCNLVISGTVSPKDSDSAILNVSIQANALAVGRGGGPPRSNPVCRLNTQITAPFGHTVVLGLTPTETMTSVFVVQVKPHSKGSKPAPSSSGGNPKGK
jgi:hypothetical protein